MFLRSKTDSDKSGGIAERIRKDLHKIFEDKGMDVSKILIDMNEDSVNIRVCLSKGLEGRIS